MGLPRPDRGDAADRADAEHANRRHDAGLCLAGIFASPARGRLRKGVAPGRS